MYLRHYNLNELPFELSPDPKFLFLTPRHREALSNLEYGLFAAKSLTVVIGDAGTGKTTLLHTALTSERCRIVRCVYVNNPALTRQEFVNTLAARFALGPEAAQSKSVLVEQLENAVRKRREVGEITALVVDEAHCLSVELFEEIRLLANIETPSQKLLPLVLAGQSELGARLEEPNLRQLKQRVALRCELAPFQLSETAAYIASRVEKAGGVPARLFTRDAVETIHDHSGGIPRTISVICDNALLTGMALNCQTVNRAMVLEVCRDFAFRNSGRAYQGPPATAVTAVTAQARQDEISVVLPSRPQETVQAPAADQRTSPPDDLEPARGLLPFRIFGSRPR